MTNRFGLTRALVFLALLFYCGTVTAGIAPSVDTQNVYWFADETDTGGNSHLTRTNGMILITLEAEDLIPGHAHTLWWVVFNYPTECVNHPDPCGGADFANPDVGAAVGNATGNIAKSDGTLEFGGRMVQGATEADSGHQVLFGADGSILLTASPHDAEVHLVVQSHGQGRGGNPLREQLTYFVANCTPDCVDVQFSIHQP